MPANINPIFPLTPNVKGVTLITADTSMSVPVTYGQVAMVGGANGTRVDAMKVRAIGTNVATVLRIFVNDGQGVSDANFTLVHEVALATTTASTSAATGVDTVLLPINYDNAGGGAIPPYLAPNQKLYVSLGTTVAAGYDITTFGGDY